MVSLPRQGTRPTLGIGMDICVALGIRVLKGVD